MRIRKPPVRVTVILALIAVGVGLLSETRSNLNAAQGEEKRPSARLEVAATPPRMMFSSTDNHDDYPRFLKTQQLLIKSYLILDTALWDPKIARLPSIKDRTDSLAWLAQNLEVKNLTDSEILEISMSPACGASVADQAAIINAVKSAYIDQVFNVDVQRRTQRHQQLRALKDRYHILLKEKRAALRRLSDSPANGESLAGLEKDVLPHLYRDLRSQHIKLRMERAEVETLLARRKKGESAATDPGRKEIVQLEDRLAVLSASQKVLGEELEQLERLLVGWRAGIADLRRPEGPQQPSPG